MGMATMSNVTKLVKNKSVSIATKIELMKGLVWSAVTNGCESWTLKKADEQRIQTSKISA